MKEERFICVCCEEKFPVLQQLEFGGQALYPDCLEKEMVVCSSCSDRMWNDTNADHGSTLLCQHCYNRNYTYCTHCRHLHAHYDRYDEDKDEPMCWEYYSNRRRTGINEYY